MAVSYEYLPYEYDKKPIEELVGEHNHTKLPGNIIEKVVEEFANVNGEFVPKAGEQVFIPILPPFRKKHEGLLTLEQVQNPPEPVIEEVVEPEPVVEEVVEPEPVEEEVVEVLEIEETVEAEAPVLEEPRQRILPKKTKTQDRTKQPSKDTGKLNYKLFPYTFSRPNETIGAVIRLYNDMSVGQPILKKLLVEFTKANKDALPPKLGQTVQVPVLLPFVYRHVNANEIFND